MTIRSQLLFPLVPLTSLTPLLLLVGALPMTLPAHADEEEPELGWSDTAELTFVLTGGNAETSTFGLANTLKHVGPQATFTLNAEALRAESSTTRRTAVGTPESFVIDEVEITELTAERYFLGALYDREITERLFWNVGFEGLRNELAGIDTRWVAQAGLGQDLVDREGALLKTRYAVTYTREEDLAGSTENFAGVRLGAEYEWALSEPTTFGGAAVIDENLEDTGDLRIDWENRIAVAMNERLALSLSLQILYDAEPASIDIPLVDAAGDTVDAVPAELDELDTIFKAAVIVNF